MALNRRSFLQGALATTAAMSLPVVSSDRVLGANDRVRIGVIGVGNRGAGHMKWFNNNHGGKVVAACDPDRRALDKAKSIADGWSHNISVYTDVREMLEKADLDAVAIATCNHWHCLAAVMACQAGKDVYVEKPLGHNQFEQQQLLAAARKYDRIVQVGLQQRSSYFQSDIKKFLHEDKALGEPLYVRANVYNSRGSIGKRDTPMQPPDPVDYNLWLGPAQDEPIYRDRFQYQWHWKWNTGNGEMGNWGVHVLDDVRNVALQDQVAFPTRLIAGGGRIVWDDAGDTPNVHFVYFDNDVMPVLFDLSDLHIGPKTSRRRKYKITRNGYTVHCEGGYYSGGRGGGVAFDNDGKRIKSFAGGGDGEHAENFIKAVKSRDRSMLHAEVEVGHHSTAWCNLANIAYRLGNRFEPGEAMAIRENDDNWQALLEKTSEHVANYDVDMHGDAIQLSPVLTFDGSSEQFVGDHADRANALLSREYRDEFRMPSKV
jgi:predicted dehydrogenase